MKAWITAPFDDKGIEEIEIIGDLNDANLVIKWATGTVSTSHFWFREGHTWHREYSDALKAARKFRAARASKASAEVERLRTLPAIRKAAA